MMSKMNEEPLFFIIVVTDYTTQVTEDFHTVVKPRVAILLMSGILVQLPMDTMIHHH